MNIGEASRASGVSAKMIRHYEGIGLLPPATRTESGYRVFSPVAVNLLGFIRRARSFGFSMAQIRLLVGLWQNRDRESREVKRIALAHVADLDRRIAELTAMREALQDLADACHGNHRPDCPILKDLESAGHHDAPPAA
jgi:MerR family copper efflux transcriptional regulator